MVSRRIPKLIALIAGSVTSVASAQSITTLFTSNNGGSAGGANYFQIVVGPNPITITGIDINTSAVAGTQIPCRVYTTPNTHSGNEANAAVWTLQANGNGSAAGQDIATPMTLDNSIILAANTSYGICVTLSATSGTPASAALRYSGTGTSPAPGLNQYSNPDLTLNLGTALNIPFTGTPFNPRIWNGTVRYTIGGVVGACCKPDGTCITSTIAGCPIQGGVYLGDGTTCATANCPQPPTGACCFENGTCTVLTAALCAAQGGNYGGNSTTCAAANCPQPGACCMPDGSCVILTQAKCTTTAGGVYQGASTVCASAGCFTAPTLWKNGPLSTGALAQSGFGAPAGTTFAEVANNTGQTTVANTTSGFSALGAIRNADNFTIVAPGGWQIDKLILPTYQTGSTTTPTITGVTLQIWNGRPGDAGAAVVFGDTTTNRMSAVNFGNMYRCFNSVVPAVCAGAATVPDLNRPIMLAEVTVGTTLGPGTYWLDWNIAGSLASGPWSPSTTIKGLRQASLANDGRQFNAAWVDTNDAGQGCTPTAVRQDFAFELRGSIAGGGCYANCDNSTSPPILNALDFGCFLTKFAAGDTYANCDNSTSAPVLNALDFGCFLTKFAAGCT